MKFSSFLIFSNHFLQLFIPTSMDTSDEKPSPEDKKIGDSPIKPIKTITGQIYGSILQNLSETKSENNEEMDVDSTPIVIPQNIDFCRVRFIENGVKRRVTIVVSLYRRVRLRAPKIRCFLT